nr:ion-channel protein [Salmonella sp. NCTC 7297]
MATGIAEVSYRQPRSKLKRMGLEYVDIFYHHRPIPNAA